MYSGVLFFILVIGERESVSLFFFTKFFTTIKNVNKMKTNDKQKMICDLIIQQAEFWKSSNDIDSPTHRVDNYVNVKKLEELKKDDEEDLINFLDNLWSFIRTLK